VVEAEGRERVAEHGHQPAVGVAAKEVNTSFVAAADDDSVHDLVVGDAERLR
jgi:hypothetical protein